MSPKSNLPQVCVKCRKLKLATLGKFIKSARWGKSSWMCLACAEPTGVQRMCRRNDETPPEREVRSWLTQKKVPAVAEFSLKGFIFDFAIPTKRVLIELDSKRYHRCRRHLARDAIKTKTALDDMWKIIRVPIGPHMLLDLELALTRLENS